MTDMQNRTAIQWMCVLTLGLLGHAAAQVTGATVTGNVTDTRNAAIPEARIQIVNQATGETRNVKANTTGGYTAPNLSPGTYSLTITAPASAQQF